MSVNFVQARTRDRWVPPLMLLMGVLSAVSFIVFHYQDVILINIDSISRLMISRRVVDSWEPSFAQLGTVWLPLTHILSLPLIMIQPFYTSGLAGSIVSMLSFVVVTFYLYKLVVKLTGDRRAGLFAVFVVVVNVEVLYLQATPMTELPLYAALLATTYHLLRYEQERQFQHLFWSGLAIAAGSLIRYEAWFLLPAQAMVIGWVLLRKQARRTEIEAHLITWGYWALMGIGLWLLWNQVIVGDLLAFQRGEYAKPSLWVSANDPVIGHWDTSFLSYLYATVENLGPFFYIGIVAFVLYLLKNRLRPGTLAPLTLMIFFPAFVAMLYLGQRPLYVPQFYEGDRYNIRFALIMLLPLAVFTACLVKNRIRLNAILAGVVLALAILKVTSGGVINQQEVATDLDDPQSLAQLEAADWLRENYDGRTMLLETYGNERLLFYSHISMRRLITEGTYGIWEPALADPAAWADWIVMRGPRPGENLGAAPDVIWESARGNAIVQEEYEMVFANPLYEIYHRPSKQTTP